MNGVMRTTVVFFLVASSALATEEPIQLHPGYVHGQYTFRGKWEIVAGATNLKGSFSGKTTADTFECSWVFDKENKTGLGGSTGTVKIDQNGGLFSMNGEAEQEFSDPTMAIWAATGVSYGSVPLMYGLWTGNKSAVFPGKEIKTTKVDDKIVVSGDDGTKTVALVGGKVVSVRTEIDNSEERAAASLEITDEEVEESLRALGIPASKERMDEMRGILEAAQESEKNAPNIVTTITVTVDGLNK
jgi:hypothetical protein